ncbi:MAG: hypothetical protein ABSC19_08305 [Syntrophorhabdales bacterium]|jgi:hypothetical protein
MRMMWCILCPAIALAMVAGCATPYPSEMAYTTSYKLAIANQTLHPEAAENTTSVAVLQAPEATKIYEKYYKGFEKAQPDIQYVIPVGGQGSFSR